MRNRKWTWLVVAGVLLGLAAYLMGRGEPPEKTAAADKIDFPTRMRAKERERLDRRRTLRPEVVAAMDAASKKPARPRDPMLAALPTGKGKTAVVFEANALRNSPIGELLLDCIRTRAGDKNPFEEMKKQTGVDVLTDVDRVAATSNGMMISGNFAGGKFDEIFSKAGARSTYGDHGVIYTPAVQSGETTNAPRRNMAFAVWNNEMLISGSSPEDVQHTIDRLEGRVQDDEPPVISEQDSYGEVYGVIAPNELAQMFPPDQRDLADKLKEAAEQVKLHVDASGDVAMVADVGGPDSDKVSDLGKTFGGLLSLARIKAQADHQDELAELLELAKVRPGGGNFRAEFALPMEFLQQKLAWCRGGPTDGGGLFDPPPEGRRAGSGSAGDGGAGGGTD